MKKAFFEWIAECCRLMGKDRRYGVLLVADPSWFYAYDDGMTEAAAIAEWNKSYPEGYSKEIEEQYLNNQGIA